ncbi:MAG: BamA/TamA family outer membrane protein, partial [Gemmatimonadales bacterium]
GDLAFAQLDLPYFEAASPRGATLTLDDRRDRIFRYRDGAPIPADTLQNRYLLLRADYSKALRASPFGYVRVGAAAQLRRDDYVSDFAYRANGAFPRSMTGAVGAYVEVERVRKPTVHGFKSFGRAEDVDLSSLVRLSLFVAPGVLGYGAGHAGFAPGIAAHTGIQFPGGLAYADVVASGLYSAGRLDSGQVFLSGTLALLPPGRHQLIVHGEVAALQNPLPGTEFDLGLGAGPRAFTQHAFTGDREFFATAEYRYALTPEFLKVAGVGLAAFVDEGGAWWSGDPHRSGWDYGVGLRLGASRAPELDANRIDLAWRAAQPGLPGGWVLAVGKGFVFSTGLRGTSR